MKKYFYFVTAALMALTSCSSEDEPIKGEDGELTPVTISVELPYSRPQSRVNEDEANIPGKGRKIKTLQYAIYDTSNNLVVSSSDKEAPQATIDPEDHGHFSLKVPLLKNHDYKFYVWASADFIEKKKVEDPDNPGEKIEVVSDSYVSPYTFNAKNRQVTVDYTKVVANDERMDAFFGYHEYHIKNEPGTDDVYTIILNRPFGQLNILVNDNFIAEKLEKTGQIQSVEVTVNQAPGIYSVLDLNSFKASAARSSFTYKAEYPNGWDDLVHAGDGDVAKYYYLSTCYLLTGVNPDGTLNGLVGTAQEATDLVITINYTDGTFITIDKKNVPIRRNWRTDIYGSLETTDADINCRIDFNFEGTLNDGPGAGNNSGGPDDGDHSGDDNSNNETID